MRTSIVVAAFALTLAPTVRATPDDDLRQRLHDAHDIINPPTITTTEPPPDNREPESGPTETAAPEALRPNELADQAGETGAPLQAPADTDDPVTHLAVYAAVVAAAAVGIAATRRRTTQRNHRRERQDTTVTSTDRSRPWDHTARHIWTGSDQAATDDKHSPADAPRPATQDLSHTPDEAAADLIDRDISEVTWMHQELQLLATKTGHAGRATLRIQWVQLGPARSIEVAFTEIPETPPPYQWVSAADRVWRLDQPHTQQDLTKVQDFAPTLPALVTLGTPEAGRQLFLNVAACNGVNVSGDDVAVRDWLAKTLQELTGYLVKANSPIGVVVGEPGELVALPDGVVLTSEHGAINLATEMLGEVLSGNPKSRLSRPANDREAWPFPFVVIVSETHDPRWDSIASAPGVAVMSMGRRFGTGLDIEITKSALSVPSLKIDIQAAQLTESEHVLIRPALAEVETQPLHLPAPEVPAPFGHLTRDADELGDDWEPPSWPVMINVLGTPTATKNGERIKLTPQQLSALALIATRREIPAHDFKRAIWGDEDDVSAERVRDMLSVLRKKVGGLTVIPKREDGLVCAGPDLGSDVLTFDALSTRARTTPEELGDRLHQMLDLVTGRLFNYSSADQTWWRWSEIAFGMTDWTSKTTTAAETLARLRLSQSNPAAARDIAERGLIADPLNAALTEILMEAYAGLGAMQAVQRVYESHDRQLNISDLVGPSNETRLVLERLRSHASTNKASESAS